MPPDATGNNAGRQAEQKTVGGFEIYNKIGQGAMGAVFKARQISVNRVVALKILPQRLARNANFVERFLREGRAAAKLDHPNIVQAIDAGHADGYYYFAMEFVKGHSVKAFLNARGKLPERQALEITRDVAKALVHAHSAGIIHRDIKPDNILIASDGTAKLADLGLARAVEREDGTATHFGDVPDAAAPGDHADSGLTQAGAALGTPHYISPEQVRGETDLDGRADLYSLGATLYHMAVGATPYPHGTPAEVMARHLSDPVPDPRKANPDLSPGLASVVRRAMAKPREQRRPDATAFLLDIENLLAGKHLRATAGAVSVSRPARPRAQRAARKRRTWLYVGSTVAVVALAIVAVVSSPSWRRRSPLPAPKEDANGPRRPAPADPPRRPPDPPPKDPDPDKNKLKERLRARDKKMLDEVRVWVTSHPGRHLPAVERYEDLVAKMKTRDLAAVAREELATQQATLDGMAEDAARDAERDAANNAVERLLDRIERAVGRGDVGAAGRLANAALKDRSLRPVKKRLEQIAKVCAALPVVVPALTDRAAKAFERHVGRLVTLQTRQGTLKGKLIRVAKGEIVIENTRIVRGKPERRQVSVRPADLSHATLQQYGITWTPKTPDEAIAGTILAFTARNMEWAESFLQGARGHPLHARYAQKLADIKNAQPDQAAKQAWRGIEPLLAKKKRSNAEAVALAKRLDDFQSQYGKTRFGASLRTRGDSLRSLLIPFYGRWPFGPEEAKRRVAETAALLGIPETKSVDLGGGVTLELALIPAGEFVMGAPGHEEHSTGAERPQHRVRIARRFYLGKCEVTQAQWLKIMGKRNQYTLSKSPANGVSWNDAQDFVDKLNQRGLGTFRLPTEAEWEYTCRAGSTGNYCFGDDPDALRQYAWSRENSDGKTHPVGQKKPNAFGLYDVHGNLREWCSDWYGGYAEDTQQSPTGPGKGDKRVARGGSYHSQPQWLRSAARVSTAPDKRFANVGFRVVLESGEPSRPGRVMGEWAFDAAEAKRRQTDAARRLGVAVEKTVDLGKGVRIELVFVPAGEFLMGSPYDEPTRNDHEGPLHRVCIAKPFYVGKFEVTQPQWERVMRANPSQFKEPRRPVERVSWHDCQVFIQRLNTLGDDRFRLPTEAEWEYACRAGAAAPFAFGRRLPPGGANVAGTKRNQSVAVGTFPPNAFGVHDMHGNVWEWCGDWYGAYPARDQRDPCGPGSGSQRVIRGGSYAVPPANARSAGRGRRDPSSRSPEQGLRVVMPFGR